MQRTGMQHYAHATRTMRATHSRQHATCDMQRTSCNMQHGACTLHPATHSATTAMAAAAHGGGALEGHALHALRVRSTACSAGRITQERHTQRLRDEAAADAEQRLQAATSHHAAEIERLADVAASLRHARTRAGPVRVYASHNGRAATRHSVGFDRVSFLLPLLRRGPRSRPLSVEATGRSAMGGRLYRSVRRVLSLRL